MGDGLRNIVPPNHGEHPEGWDPTTVVREIVAPLNASRVLDFGCGYGRLSAAFDRDAYIGIDLSPQHVTTATQRLAALHQQRSAA